MKDKREAEAALKEGIEKFPNSETIVLALQKLNRELLNYKEAENLLVGATFTIQSERIPM